MNEQDCENDNCEEFMLHPELISAIESHNCGQVYDLVHNYGFSPNVIIDGENPICKAAHLGYVDILEILVEGGCDVTIPERVHDVWHRRPIHIAASKGHVAFVKRLLSLGVDINSRDNDARTPLHWAASYGNDEMTEFLISEGATVNTSQCDGFTPLHAATCLGHDRVCRVLLKYGAEIDMADRDGWTAFHTSVCYGHVQVVKTLLDSGASLSKLTVEEENVIHIAASSGKIDVVRLLIDKGVEINALNLNGNTAFTLAVYYNELEMAKYLAKIGADMSIPNGPQKSPLYLASLRCSLEFISLFVFSGYNFSNEPWLIQKDFPIELEKMPAVCGFLHRLATNPRSLKHLCANLVRTTLKFDNDMEFSFRLTQIGLPPILQEFVSYRNIDEIEPLRKY